MAHKARCLKMNPEPCSSNLLPHDDNTKVLLYEVYRDDARIRQHRSLAHQTLLRLRCNINPDCCCYSDFIGTKRIDGRVTASQIVAVSLASFLPLADRYSITSSET